MRVPPIDTTCMLKSWALFVSCILLVGCIPEELDVPIPPMHITMTQGKMTPFMAYQLQKYMPPSEKKLPLYALNLNLTYREKELYIGHDERTKSSMITAYGQYILRNLQTNKVCKQGIIQVRYPSIVPHGYYGHTLLKDKIDDILSERLAQTLYRDLRSFFRKKP